MGFPQKLTRYRSLLRVFELIAFPKGILGPRHCFVVKPEISEAWGRERRDLFTLMPSMREKYVVKKTTLSGICLNRVTKYRNPRIVCLIPRFWNFLTSYFCWDTASFKTLIIF